jgi:Tfp pilus assembly protein PilF
MLRSKIFIPICFFLLSFCFDAFALNWIELHDQAEEISLEQAEKSYYENREAPEYIYMLALVYLEEYKDDAAEAMFNKLLQADPDSVPARWGISEIKRRRYQLDQAVKQLVGLISQDPEFAPAYVTLAYTKFSLKEYEQALRLAKTVVAKGPEKVDKVNYVRAYLIMAGARGMLAQQGGPVARLTHGLSVLTSLNKAKKLMPDYSGVHLGLGGFYLLAPGFAGGNLEKAKFHLEKAIELDPGLVDSYVRLAQVYKAEGNPEKFQEYLMIALNKDPRNFLANEVKQMNLDLLESK